jgi:hypothetical protein
LQQLKRLTPEQREKATELISNQEMEMQIEEQKKKSKPTNRVYPLF